MIAYMSSRYLSSVIWVVSLVIPSIAMAEEGEWPDARLVGYNPNVALEGGSTATTWLLLIGLAIICIAPLFMNARRTHLD